MRYNYKVNKGDEYVGFIAEDVPELVASEDRKSLASMDFVAVLVKVVQEQKREMAARGQKIARLETDKNAQIAALKTRLNKLNAKVEMLVRAMASSQMAQAQTTINSGGQ